MFLTFMLAVLTQERRRGSAGCSVMSSLLTCQTEKADINKCQSVTGWLMEKILDYSQEWWLWCSAWNGGCAAKKHETQTWTSGSRLLWTICVMMEEMLIMYSTCLVTLHFIVGICPHSAVFYLHFFRCYWCCALYTWKCQRLLLIF